MYTSSQNNSKKSLAHTAQPIIQLHTALQNQPLAHTTRIMEYMDEETFQAWILSSGIGDDNTIGEE